MEPSLAGLVFAGLVTLLTAFGLFFPDPASNVGLSIDQACDVPIQEGRAVADLYLSPDVAVKLLVSNLGHSHQTSRMTVHSERLNGHPHFRPVPPLLVTSLMRLDERAGPVGSPNPMNRVTTSADGPGDSPHAYQPPDSRDFWLHVTAEPLEDARGYQSVHGRLTVTRQTVQVYVDHSLRGTAGFPRTIQDLATDVAERLEQSVLSEIRSSIGPVTDVDRDGRLTVLITPWLSRLRGGATQVRGFVRSSDFRDDVSAPFSNHADVLYLSSDLPSGTGLQTLLLHEVAHAALFSTGTDKRVVERSAIKRSDRGTLNDSRQPKYREWEDWLNEGLAHLSERSGGGDWSNLDYRVAQFWQQTATAPLIVGDYYRSGRWRDHGCRGATYLFLEWCQREYTRAGHTDFIPALVATGQPGLAAVVQVMGQDFDELYRDWTLSLVARQNDATLPSRIGRFEASGPRQATWDISQATQQTWDISGTATQFVELRTVRAGWYRVIFEGDPHQPWQLTVLNSSRIRPSIGILTNWNADVTAERTNLVVSTSQPLPPDWQFDRLTCEEIRETHPRVWEWPADQIQTVRDSGKPIWRVPNRTVELPLADRDLDPAVTVIKVRLKNSSGEVVWAWCDLPRRLLRTAPRTRIATVSRTGDLDQ